ncbi:MAG: TRAP transporter substrate-binding protein DctP [Polyangiaceae bacterium]|nr:TRAP transporter substrate-binding protein DctP [Polyangiaceae bacterium]MCL4750256.1 TRAP transporter substrate-binding protein DctP [Myxococcales bacterium]
MRLLFACLVACAFLLHAAPGRADTHKLRVGTLAPKNSAWGKVFKVWQKALSQKSGGKLELEVYYNASQGMEDTMVSKMKTGSLDGAALTSVGMSRITKDVMVLQLPGVVDSWDLLDKVRADLAPELEKRFEKEGFQVVGWGDLGLIRQWTRGFELRRPSDLKGRRPLVWRNEPIGPAIYTSIGGVVPTPLSPTEVLPALRAGKIEALNAPALAAEQLQWTPYLDHVSSTASVCAIGGTVFRKKALDDLPKDLQTIFWDLQKRATQVNKDRVRKQDAQAYTRIAKKMKVVDLSSADREEWRKVIVPALKQLGQGTLSGELVERVLKLTGKS